MDSLMQRANASVYGLFLANLKLCQASMQTSCFTCIPINATASSATAGCLPLLHVRAILLPELYPSDMIHGFFLHVPSWKGQSAVVYGRRTFRFFFPNWNYVNAENCVFWEVFVHGWHMAAVSCIRITQNFQSLCGLLRHIFRGIWIRAVQECSKLVLFCYRSSRKNVLLLSLYYLKHLFGDLREWEIIQWNSTYQHYLFDITSILPPRRD